MTALIGCDAGPSVESRIVDLRVVAVALATPEARPGETVDGTVWVADPEDLGYRVWTWTCAGPPGECLESDPERVVEGESVALVAPAEAASLLAGEDEVPITVWSLACAPEVCPAAWSAEDLADPARWIGALPLRKVSLARRTLILSDRDDDERRENPTLTPRFGELDARPDEKVDLDFEVSGDVSAVYGFSTAGGFESPDEPVVDGIASARWIAPPASRSVDLWAVAVAPDGGQAVWAGAVEVR